MFSRSGEIDLLETCLQRADIRRKLMTTRSSHVQRGKENVSGEATIESRRQTGRQHIEKTLRESEDKYRNLFENARDAIILADTETGIIVDVNAAGCRLLGLPKEKIVGLHQSEINPPEMAEKYQQLFHDHIEKGTGITEDIIIQRADGSHVPVDISASVVKIADKSIIQGIFRDVTERKQAEELLKKSEKKYSTLVESGNDGVIIIQDGLLKFANLKMTEIAGFLLKEVINKPFVDFISPEYRDAVVQNYKKRMLGEIVPNHYEAEIINKGDSRIPVEISASLIEYEGKPANMAIVREITERKRVEKALKESEEKFSVAFRSSPEIIAIVNLKTGKYVDINDSYARTTGYSREEIIGHPVNEIDMWVRPEESLEMTEIIKAKGKISNREYSFRIKSGEIRQWLCSAETITIGGDECIISVAVDITERKQAENNLKLALAGLEHSTAQLKATNKELESFSYSVSHDLRSPLRSIDGFSQALLEDYSGKLDEKGRDYLNRLRGASQKMGELIDGLLKLSRLTRSEMHLENIDLSALAEEISTRLRETHPDQQAEFIINGGLTADGDPQMLRALLENLLGNAWKFTRKTPHARIEFGSTTNEAKKTFFVKDNGAGFDMSYVDKLFGAFQRLHDTADFPGTGIGLATVQRIINRHGGSIRAEGKVGQGATFYFNLS